MSIRSNSSAGRRAFNRYRRSSDTRQRFAAGAQRSAVSRTSTRFRRTAERSTTTTTATCDPRGARPLARSRSSRERFSGLASSERPEVTLVTLGRCVRRDTAGAHSPRGENRSFAAWICAVTRRRSIARVQVNESRRPPAASARSQRSHRARSRGRTRPPGRERPATGPPPAPGAARAAPRRSPDACP
jgi:hypothetical protein